MGGHISRRQAFGLVGAGVALGSASRVSAEPAVVGRTSHELREALEAVPAVDVHSHAFPEFAPVTEKIFLAELALGTWMLDAYFPSTSGNTPRLWERTLYDEWKEATASEKAKLNRKYGIEQRFDEVCYHMSETIFVKQLIKEMATFFRCRPTLSAVIAARNEYTQGNFWGYVNDLFNSVKLDSLFVQGSIGTWTTPENTVAEFDKEVDATVYNVATASATDLLQEDISFDSLISRYSAELEREIKDNNAVAMKSGIAKGAGADVQPWTYAQAEEAWEEFRKLPPEMKIRAMESTSRPESARIVQHYIVWQTTRLAYEWDIPLHIHIGNGEGQDMLSTHYPYKLENVIRYPVELPQKPAKIVLIHGGWPHVDEAAYLCHIFPNVWFDMSLMNPIANRGLHERMLTVLESAPVSKIMFGSDAYHLPEFFYLAAKWARKYTASSLSVLVDEGVLTMDEAVRAGTKIMRDNALELHKLKDASRM